MHMLNLSCNKPYMMLRSSTIALAWVLLWSGVKDIQPSTASVLHCPFPSHLSAPYMCAPHDPALIVEGCLSYRHHKRKSWNIGKPFCAGYVSSPRVLNDVAHVQAQYNWPTGHSARYISKPGLCEVGTLSLSLCSTKKLRAKFKAFYGANLSSDLFVKLVLKWCYLLEW